MNFCYQGKEQQVTDLKPSNIEGSVCGYLYLSTKEMLNLSFSLRNKSKAGMALTAHVDYVGLSYHNLDFCNTITYQTQNFEFQTARIFTILRL